jgi:hypothetical protein
MKQTKNSAKSIFLLSLTALIWGSTFVAQSSGMDYVEPFTFIGKSSRVNLMRIWKIYG